MNKLFNFDSEISPKKKINKRKLTITITFFAIILIILVMMIIYSSNKPFRKFLDRYLFRKNISEEKLVSIELDYNSNVEVLAYNKNIGILAENKLMLYNQSGELVSEIKLEISNPTYYVNNKYLAISEKNSSKIYLISGTKIIWEKEVDGNVSKLDVNENGYVSAILTGTTYKSVIETFDAKGHELFKTYLSTTNAMDATISTDNKYLAFAEVNTTGTVIQSNIKIVSIEKAKETPSESFVYTYEASSNSLVTNIQYQNKNKLVCIYDDSIHVIEGQQDNVIMQLNDNEQKITAADIKLEGNVYRAIEKSTGLFSADTIIEIQNIENNKYTVYTVEGVTKTIYCFDNIIAANLGQDVEFINTNGWLIKSFTSSQDIKNIVIGNNLAGIIYTDKVEIINL